MRLSVCLCVCLAAQLAASETKYAKVGEEVVLQPGTPPGTTITNVIWKVGPDIAMEWDGTSTDAYRQYGDRGRLDNATGDMTITALTFDDSGLYTPEINNNKVPVVPVHLQVLSPVPTPTLNKTCDDEMKSCTLTCDGDAAATAEPLTYSWKFGDKVLVGSSKELRITKEDNSDVEEFICDLQNPVSQQSSRPVPNPFTSAADEGPLGVGNMKISTGLTVFISLLAAVILLGVVHRVKAGMWFFQKDSMPWEADFWSKSEGQRRQAAESNGAAAGGMKESSVEETPMM